MAVAAAAAAVLHQWHELLERNEVSRLKLHLGNNYAPRFAIALSTNQSLLSLDLEV